jgi:hypothetical protein
MMNFILAGLLGTDLITLGCKKEKNYFWSLSEHLPLTINKGDKQFSFFLVIGALISRSKRKIWATDIHTHGCTSKHMLELGRWLCG